MEKETKTAIMQKYARHEGDVGSPEVQIAVLSTKIAELTDHMRSHKKDNSSRFGLMAMVNRRKRLLKYLSKENHERYLSLAAELGTPAEVPLQREPRALSLPRRRTRYPRPEVTARCSLNRHAKMVAFPG